MGRVALLLGRPRFDFWFVLTSCVAFIRFLTVSGFPWLTSRKK